ncbi:MAG: hypothetical protein EXX96DRAFT_541444 [Benjaminiella poitrasii]|nr:MAG: hypothetical protein EXX96DRAFT_541444 [Benjaminiella poitrasii]
MSSLFKAVVIVRSICTIVSSLIFVSIILLGLIVSFTVVLSKSSRHITNTINQSVFNAILYFTGAIELSSIFGYIESIKHYTHQSNLISIIREQWKGGFIISQPHYSITPIIHKSISLK